jgi:3-hydroxymyristoyl/3-hydroxydecanoyl-(acyl carrier protein) dehydratase
VNSLQFDFFVPADHPCLGGHFPGNPVVPGVLLLDHVFHELRRETGRQVSRLQRVKFLSALKPAERARGCCEIDGVRLSFRVTTERAGAAVVVAEGEGTLSAREPP